jgi:hypothetical protein
MICKVKCICKIYKHYTNKTIKIIRGSEEHISQLNLCMYHAEITHITKLINIREMIKMIIQKFSNK